MNPLDKAKEMASNLQKQAGEMAENLIGEENIKKVSDVLNTDVGAAAMNALDKAEDVVEKVTGIDLDGKPGA